MILSARPTGGAAVISVKRTSGSPTRQLALRNYICDFVRLASDNGTCRMRVPQCGDGDRASTAGLRAPLRTHAVSVATRANDRQRSHRCDEVAGLLYRRTGIETGVRCAALGE